MTHIKHQNPEEKKSEMYSNLCSA